jgi:hypothetical protein
MSDQQALVGLAEIERGDDPGQEAGPEVQPGAQADP